MYPVTFYNIFTWGRIQSKTWFMRPYVGVDYNLSLCPLQSRLQRIYHGNPMPEPTLSPSQGLGLDLASALKRKECLYCTTLENVQSVEIRYNATVKISP
jgi:hypothetical protein